MAPARRGSEAAASGPPQQRLRRLLGGNNAAPPRVARRGAGRRTPDTRARAAERAGGRAGVGRPRREPWARRGAGPGCGAARRRGGPERGAGAASSRHRGRGPGDEGARGGEPVCAPRRRPAQRASPSRQTRGRRSGGAPPPGPKNVKRGGRRRRDGRAGRPRRPPAAAPFRFPARRGRADSAGRREAAKPPSSRAPHPRPSPPSDPASARSGFAARTRREQGPGRCVRPRPRLLAQTSLNNDHSQPRWEDNGQKMPGHPETLSVKFSPGWRGEVFFSEGALGRGGRGRSPRGCLSQWQGGRFVLLPS